MGAEPVGGGSAVHDGGNEGGGGMVEAELVQGWRELAWATAAALRRAIMASLLGILPIAPCC